MSFQFEWAERSDLPAAQRFVARHFGADSVQAQAGRLAWLGFDHPAGTCTWLGRAGADPVALCCHIPAMIRAGEQVAEAAFAVDLMVDPQHRRRGIGRESLRARCERFGASLSSGQSATMAGLYESRENHRRLARWHRALFVRRVRPAANLRGTVREVAAGLGRRLHGSCPGRRVPVDLEEASVRLAEIPRRLAADEAGIGITAEHFRWRYGGPVYRDYRCCWLAGDAGPSGLLVSRQAGPTEYLVDLFCAPEARRDCFRLAGETTPGDRLVADSAGRPLAAAQRDAGFLVRPLATEMVAYAEDAARLAVLDGFDWCSFAGESDADLIRKPLEVDPV